MYVNMDRKMRFKRFCDKCGNKFRPTGKYQRCCHDCIYNTLSYRKGKSYKVKYIN